MNSNTQNILNTFDLNITKLNLSAQNIIGILDLSRFTQLKILICKANKITQIINMPETLEELDCKDNEITSLDNLPENLNILKCQQNKLTKLENLPLNLTVLNCEENKNLESLDYLPSNLNKLCCNMCNIKNLSCLPANLKALECKNNKDLQIDNLPENLLMLVCSKIPISIPPNCKLTLSIWSADRDFEDEDVKKRFPNVSLKYIL